MKGLGHETTREPPGRIQMTTRLWSPTGDCHIGLTTGHTFIVPGDERGIEVPQRFRRAAIARGCILVGSVAEEGEPAPNLVLATRGAAKRPRATRWSMDGPTHLPVPRRAPGADSEARVRSDNQRG